MKIDINDWQKFVEIADSYYGPLTIGQLFCEMYNCEDRKITSADDDAVWQMIYDRHVMSDRNPIWQFRLGKG